MKKSKRKRIVRADTPEGQMLGEAIFTLPHTAPLGAANLAISIRCNIG